MLRQRHERFIKYLIIRGKGRNSITPEKRAESDRRIREIEAAIASKLWFIYLFILGICSRLLVLTFGL